MNETIVHSNSENVKKASFTITKDIEINQKWQFFKMFSFDTLLIYKEIRFFCHNVFHYGFQNGLRYSISGSDRLKFKLIGFKSVTKSTKTILLYSCFQTRGRGDRLFENAHKTSSYFHYFFFEKLS